MDEDTFVIIDINQVIRKIYLVDIFVSSNIR